LVKGGLVIYFVVPPELGDDVFQRLEERYRDNANVTVIRERRQSERRTDATGGGDRQLRDRRRRRLPGSVDV
jgi:hypothetical protein